jgi:hypothetical protein
MPIEGFGSSRYSRTMFPLVSAITFDFAGELLFEKDGVSQYSSSKAKTANIISVVFSVVVEIVLLL